MPNQPRLLVSCTRIASLVSGQPVVVASDHIRVRVLESGRVPPTEVRVLPVECGCPRALAQAADFEQEAFDRYLPIIAMRLNAMHGCERSEAFWTAVIGSTLLSHISNCRRVFAIGTAVADSDFQVDRLSERSFRTPENEAEFANHFVYSELGDEQLFSTLVGPLSPGATVTFEESADWRNHGPRPGLVARSKRRARRALALIARHPSILWQQARVASRRRPSPSLLVVQCFWSRATKLRVELTSGGRIAIDDRPLTYARAAADPHSTSRERLAAAPAGATPFDRFVFDTLRWAAPTSWVENFQARHAAAEARLAEWPTVRSIANESQDEDSSLLLAVARSRGVKIIYCEHGYLQHQFIGRLVWLVSRNVDRYLSVGWSRAEFPEIEPGGSLFNWTEPPKRKRDIDLLFVAGVALVRGATTMSGYGEAGNNAQRFFSSTSEFLAGLSARTRRRMYYRDYPVDRRAVLGMHARERDFLTPHAASFGTLDKLGHESTPSLMSRSQLVVVNYLSTAYNEALLSDVPTIVLWNPATCPLREEEKDFYQELVQAGIVQTNPEAAASLVERIIDDPWAWWHTPTVRRARDHYVSLNFAGPEALERKLREIAATGVEC